MFERKHRAARYSIAGQGTAPYGTARRCVAEPYSWAELSCTKIFSVIQHKSTWCVQQQYRCHDTLNDTWHLKHTAKARKTAQHDTSPCSRTARHGTGRARQGTARRWAAELALRCALLSGAEVMMRHVKPRWDLWYNEVTKGQNRTGSHRSQNSIATHGRAHQGTHGTALRC